ncbi:hypothetical protein OPV22_014209 [Ensete ventricosum]|uniref:Uncharacterized protein n=1 Tax=Ensete ventricosum TaxID=4639 RepID=A0AAV8PJV9_ENSVE|nr:hypothetical protein OPV22_014209 [Ensete ventricosum]
MLRPQNRCFALRTDASPSEPMLRPQRNHTMGKILGSPSSLLLMQRPATSLYNITAHLPVVESIGFSLLLVIDIRQRKGLKKQITPLPKYQNQL